MEFLLATIEELALLEPALVPIAKFSLVILICIIAYIPVALLHFSWSRHSESSFRMLLNTLNV